MLTVKDAVDYATDRGCKVGDDVKMCFSNRKCFTVKKGFNSVRVTQAAKGSRLYSVDGEFYNRANAIVTAVNYIIQDE